MADLGSIENIVGTANVLRGADDLTFYCHDISGPADAMARAVVRPGTVAEVVAVVGAARAAGLAVFPRGGGMSYTRGYLPTRADGILLDLGRLDRIVDISAADRRVVVEAGCTWGKLYDALAEQGLRTPYFGPLSGAVATVGGSLSQDAIFFGSAMYGFAGDSVLGVDVVTGDGTLLSTSPTGAKTPDPLGRQFGPDATGLFIGDCGALGIKVRATLRLIPQPAATGFASFDFDSGAALLAAQLALTDVPGLADVFGFDPETHRNLERGGFSMLEGATLVADVLRAGRGLLRGATAAARMARSGKAYMRDLSHSLHLVAEGGSDDAAAASIRAAAAVCGAHGGRAIPDALPRVTRARPFRPIKALRGPAGEAWLPVHGVLPRSRLVDFDGELERFLAENAADMAAHGIRVSRLTCTSGDLVCIEPQFFWPDALNAFHLRAATPEQIRQLKDAEPNPAARALVHRLRADLLQLFRDAGARQVQLGKYYPYGGDLAPPALALIRSIKRQLDPDGIINPGALGLTTNGE